jgi:small subunit ribosomal protein S2
MSALTLKELLDAGAHFGHQTKRWNPKMKRYILCPRNSIYIIDLNKTVEGLDKFIARVKDEVQKGGKVLFVGTKKQVKDCIREEAIRANMPYITERWLGGMLTNFQTIRLSVKKLEKIEAMEADGTLHGLTKKEAQTMLKRKEKLLSVLSGIRHLRKIPALIFVVDTLKEHIAVEEARRLGIPTGAIVDTNCDPEMIDYVIPGNDDALKSVHLITKAVADTIISVGDAAKIEELEKLEKDDDIAVDLSDESSDEVDDIAVDVTGDIVGDVAGATAARKKRVVRKKMVETPVDE